MNGTAPTTASSTAPWWARRPLADALATAAAVVFLILCMALPLVGPAAAHGSGSPGATRAPHYPKNVAAFLAIWTLAAALTAASIALWVRLRGCSWGDRRLRALGALGGILIGIFIAFLTGALGA